MQDLLDQFNFVGFHDLCIYPESVDIEFIMANPSLITGGEFYIDCEQSNSEGYYQSATNPIFV